MGKGNNVQICFHGFGQYKEVFETWPESLENVQIYSFDLFFHGESKWKEKNDRLDKAFLKGIFEKFFIEESIKQFSIISFSIGARYIWPLLELFPQKIKKLHLIAPDGISENIWFRLASKSILGQSFFKFLCNHKWLLPTLTKFAHRCKIISQNHFKLAQSQIQNWEKRQQIYQTWILLAKLKYHAKQSTKIIQTQNISCVLYHSINDKIIPSKNLKKLLKNVFCERIELNTPHHKVLKEAKFLWINIEKHQKNV